MHAFGQYLAGLHGLHVEVDRGSPEVCQGWLAVVCDNYVSLLSATGELLHRPLFHIHSIAAIAPLADHAPVWLGVAPQPASFRELLTQHVGQAVRLNHAGPGIGWGILRTVLQDHLLLERAAGEAICYQVRHIRSLCLQTDATKEPALDGTDESRQGG